MKRALIVTALLAMGLLVASPFASAQEKPAAPAPTFGGEVSVGALTRPDVGSSKFQEYGEVVNGLAMPFVNLFANKGTFDFVLAAQNVGLNNQRYLVTANAPFMGITFDFNQTPHLMGNGGSLLFGQTAPGVYGMSPTLRGTLGTTVDTKLPTTARTYDFYNTLLSPTFSSAGSVDLNAARKRGSFEIDLGKQLPFALAVTYMREVKTGYRTRSGGDILGATSPVIDVPEPLNDLTQDFGVRAAYNFKMGNVHGSFNRNTYNNLAETFTVANPFQSADVAYTAAKGAVPALGGPAAVMFTNAPDNQASTGRFGFQLKFKRQTRFSGDFALASWTQNAPFNPYTINSTILTGTGAPANLVTSLQQASLNGKMDTTTTNFAFSSRPVRNLGIHLRYRSYDFKDNSSRYVITGDTSSSPDRSWGAADAPTADEPFGHATANRTDFSNARFDAMVNYDIKDLTLEAAFRNTRSSWAGRVASSGTDGKENGFALSAVYHTTDWLGLRANYNQANRTVSGIEAGSVAALQGVMFDHAERKSTRTGFDIELTPAGNFGVTIGYTRRNDDYPNRPFEVAGNPDTTSGLLGATYDMFTGEVEFAVKERAELSGFYTYEKGVQTNRWVTTSSGALNNAVKYNGIDRTDSFGANAIIHVVPQKWTFSFLANHQKTDGLLDISANPTGNFTTGRATLSPAGPANIPDWDDSTLTTFTVQLDRNLGQNWKIGAGYTHQKYEFADAFTAGTTLMPTSVLIFMKANNGNYSAGIGYISLGYRF